MIRIMIMIIIVKIYVYTHATLHRPGLDLQVALATSADSSMSEMIPHANSNCST